VQVETADVAVAEDLRQVDEVPSEASVEGAGDWPPRRSYSPDSTDHGSAIDRGIAGRAALKAGVLGIFVGMIPLLGVVLTGALAVYFYRRESKLVLPAALGARLGAAAAIVTFGISALLLMVRIFVFQGQQEYIKSLMQIAQGMGINAADPDFQTGIHNLFTPVGLVMTLFFWMLITVVLGLMGGALASLLQRTGNTRG
jgi:MFS family permease